MLLENTHNFSYLTLFFFLFLFFLRCLLSFNFGLTLLSKHIFIGVSLDLAVFKVFVFYVSGDGHIYDVFLCEALIILDRDGCRRTIRPVGLVE